MVFSYLIATEHMIFSYFNLKNWLFFLFDKAASQKLWNNYKKAKKWLRSCIVLFFLLGLFWILTMIAGFINTSGRYKTTGTIFRILSIVVCGSYGFFTFMYSVVCSRNVSERTRKIIKTSNFTTKTSRATISNPTIRNRNRMVNSGYTTSGSGGNTPIVNGTSSPSSSDRSTSTNKTVRI